ncbi:asparaginase [Rhodococcoides trifolii]|uniref:Asparaginase n=1 Tax=Rhodococcoides trifolii TaxID=908250 RepID=A0A917G5Q0_9NOCA|nr:asparaginase [Rhodococcus trifolii]GGG23077.1 asparaginase [Rhodococcus trifolii]
MSEALVEVVRSGFRECTHRGSAVIVDADGSSMSEISDTESPIFPRSSNKPLQAVAMLRAGFVPLTSSELAISAASHEGQREHVRLVQSLLDRFGLTAAHLRCPAALPSNDRARADAMAAGIEPTPLFMNCSGKHSAMLATCVVNEWPLADYLDPTHPLQVAIGASIADLTSERTAALGVDGCGLPIVPVSLADLARSFGRLVTSAPGTPERAVADAVREHPFLISGTGKEDEILMTAVPGLLCKSGADGVFAAALPDGTAFAFKIDDGHDRARLPLAAAALRRCGAPWSDELEALAERPVMGGADRVGTVRAMVEFTPLT